MLLELYKRHLIRILLSLVILAFFLLHVSEVFRLSALDGIELFAYDQRLKLTAPNTVDDRIVIIDIDEDSLAAEGRWPWSRNKLEALMHQLFDHYEIAIIGFDVVFAEPDVSSGLGVLQGLAEGAFSDDSRFIAGVEDLDQELNYDNRFMESMAGRRVVLGYTFNSQGTQTGVLPPPVFEVGSFKGRNIPFVGANGYAANLERFQQVAFGAGHFNPEIDQDGIVRRIPLLYEYEGAHYEALSLAIARAVLAVDQIEPGYVKESKNAKYAGLEWLQLGDVEIPVDRRVMALVPYRGRQKSFPYISATDVLSGKVDPESLKGRVALLGTSAPGLLDLRATPLDSVYPGVEIHANMIAGIIDKSIKEAPEYTLGAEFILVWVSGLFMALLLPLLSPLLGTLATVVLLGAVVAANIFIWSSFNLVLPLASGVVILFVMYLFNVTFALFVETRGKRQLAGLFGQYVPPELVDEMSEDPESFSLARVAS